MRDDRWSIPVARWGSVSLRIHLFFGLFAACTAYFVWHAQRTEANQSDLAAIGLLSLGILAAGMLLHEAAHMIVARRFGGEMDAMTIGPLIGLSHMTAPPDPRDEFLAHLAGPLANLLFALATCMGLVALGLFDVSLLNPLAPAGVIEGSLWAVGWKLAFCINWILGLLNLLPAFPFDGGRALKAAILWHAPQLGSRVAARRVTMVARLTASLLVVGAILCWPQEMHSALECFALTLLAVFVFFSPEQDPVLSASEPAALSSARAATLPSVRRLKTTDVETVGRDELRYEGFVVPIPAYPIDDQDDDIESPEEENDNADTLDADGIDEHRVDEILIRVHQHGIEGLSLEERAFLERASASYRQRLPKH